MRKNNYFKMIYILILILWFLAIYLHNNQKSSKQYN